jgi:DNA-binding MarR family transcriptional regulator
MAGMPIPAARRQPLETFSRLPGHLVRRVHQAATAYFTAECGGDITAVQYAALVAIGAHPGIDATRLSDLIYFDRSTIGDVLDRIEAKQWIVRRPAAHDRRVKVLELTALGRATAQAAQPGIGRVQARLLAPLTRREVDTFVRLLTKVAEGGDSADG